MDCKLLKRKPGRPKAIPEELVPKVFSLYRQGFGYRATARELRQEGISVNWSTVRRLVKKRLVIKLHSQTTYCHNVDKLPQHRQCQHIVQYCQGATKINQDESTKHELQYCRLATKERTDSSFRYKLMLHSL